MVRYLIATAAVSTWALAAAPTLAQDQAAMLTISESDQYGSYLSDAEGRALYLFTADTQGTGSKKAQVSCSGPCLDAWPPLSSVGKPQAGEMVDASLLGTIEHDGKTMVTYNGWPLYYFVKDQGSGGPKGQDIKSFGGEWYLVSPEGKKIEEE